MAEPLPPATESRVIRVFLSSTFRDFMEERDLLVKQVFPRLRRRAQERGVEIVDVDLRWGITEEESQQGKVIGICLAEIERCRPYFIGMLGERYGWTPQPSDYPPELFEQEQLQWIKDHQGGASVTELEILHGVLNDPKMAGRAFFYFRDPVWSRAQSEPGFVCDTAEEQAKLLALKDRIRASVFPVIEDLPAPKGIAERIEADLWKLIEEQYPDLDQADTLEREARKHASYRQSRLGVYLGQAYVDQLEALISAGEKKILISGESGSGKSALIANWMAAHGQAHPGDVVYAHHLGCSNDASAIRPLLGRMLDTASKLLVEQGLLVESIKVPQDWWELTAKVAETLQTLGRWCKSTGQRWIWVLDGLDRLAQDDQQALPWLPLLIPEGVSVVISALDCPARAIVQERDFRTLTIDPLQREEQEQLIELYLGRYTKKLEAERKQQILSCELARSPLFLRVLLEELRQCGRFETLKDQIEGYIRPKADGSLAVSDLYERVLERLENDCGVELVRSVMTALWASRAGLSETELLKITGLVQLQWVPIDLALEKAFGRNGNRLVFDHDYLRIAVQDRYLPTEEQRRQSHSELAESFLPSDSEFSIRITHEYPWQLSRSRQHAKLRAFMLDVYQLAFLAEVDDFSHIQDYLETAERVGGATLGQALQQQITNYSDAMIKEGSAEAAEILLMTLNPIGKILKQAGYRGQLLRTIRMACLRAARKSGIKRHIRTELFRWANYHLEEGEPAKAVELYIELIYKNHDPLGRAPGIAEIRQNMALAYQKLGNTSKAIDMLNEAPTPHMRKRNELNPDAILLTMNQAAVYCDKGEYKEAIKMYLDCLESAKLALGSSDDWVSTIYEGLGWACQNINCLEEARSYYLKSLSIVRQKSLVGSLPMISIYVRMGQLFRLSGKLLLARNMLSYCLKMRERGLGLDHPETNDVRKALARVFADLEIHEESIPLRRQILAFSTKRDGLIAPSTLTSIHELAEDLYWTNELKESEQLYREALAGRISALGDDDSDTMASRSGLAWCLSAQERYEEAIELRRVELAWCRQQNNDLDSGTLESIEDLALVLFESRELEEAESLFRELLAARQQVLEPGDFKIGRVLGILAKTLKEAGKLEQALDYGQQALDHCLTYEGPDAGWTNYERLDVAQVLHKLGRYREALTLLEELQGSMARLDDPDEDDRKLAYDAEELMRLVEQGL